MRRNCTGLVKDGTNARKNAYWDAADDQRVFRYERMKEKKKRMSLAMASIEVECQLYRGSVKYPRTKVMTGIRMNKENTIFAIDYGSRVQKHPDTKLWVWKVKDSKAFKKLLEKFMSS